MTTSFQFGYRSGGIFKLSKTSTLQWKLYTNKEGLSQAIGGAFAFYGGKTK